MNKAHTKGLQLELEDHDFKPRSNKNSRELSKSMKPLLERYPILEQQKEKNIKQQQEESDLVKNI